MNIKYETELRHYGVPGMKWGVTKDPQTDYSNKIRKLERKNESYANRASVTKARGAKLRAKGTTLESRSLRKRLLESNRHFERRSGKQLVRGKRLQAKGARLEAKSARYERKIYKNKIKIEQYNKALAAALREVPVHSS